MAEMMRSLAFGHGHQTACPLRYRVSVGGLRPSGSTHGSAGFQPVANMIANDNHPIRGSKYVCRGSGTHPFLPPLIPASRSAVSATYSII